MLCNVCVKQTLNYTPSPTERTCVVGVSQCGVTGEARMWLVSVAECGHPPLVWPPTSAHQTSVCLCFPAGHQPTETEVTEERQLWSGPALVMTEVVTLMSTWHATIRCGSLWCVADIVMVSLHFLVSMLILLCSTFVFHFVHLFCPEGLSYLTLTLGPAPSMNQN